MQNFSNGVEKISRWLDSLAAACIVITMLVVVLNVIMRALFQQPILGTVEYINLLTALSIAMALAYCALQGGQIAVDYVIEKFPYKIQAGIDLLTCFIALLFWSLSAWYIAGYAHSMLRSNLVTSTTQIPLYPVIYLIAIGFLGLCLVLLVKLTESIRKAVQ